MVGAVSHVSARKDPPRQGRKASIWQNNLGNLGYQNKMHTMKTLTYPKEACNEAIAKHASNNDVALYVRIFVSSLSDDFTGQNEQPKGVEREKKK